MSHLYQLELSSRIGEMFQFFANVQDFFESSKFINNSSLKIQYIAKQPCAASTRDL